MYASFAKYNDNDTVSNIYTSHTPNNPTFMHIKVLKMWLLSQP